MTTQRADLTVADAGKGDKVYIQGKEYRLMIEQRDGWLCRLTEEGESGPHHWVRGETPVEKISFVQPKRNPKARKEVSYDRNDPLFGGGR